LSQLVEIRVPDIGDFDEVEVVEILVTKGDRVELEDPLVSIESEKATMEIPSSAAGIVSELSVAEGDRVSEGSLLLVLEVESAAADATRDDDSAKAEPTKPESTKPDPTNAEPAKTTPAAAKSDETEPTQPAPSETEQLVRPAQPSRPTQSSESTPPAASKGRVLSSAAANPMPDRTNLPHASPLVRRFARELGVAIDAPAGTGSHGRVLVDDLKRHVRERFATDESRSGAGIPPIPVVDHSAFGPVHEQALSRIQKVSGPVLHRSWLNLPHVTQHDEADITELERFRRDRKQAASEHGVKLSPLLFVMKAVVVALREHPMLRSSLAPEGDRVIIKDYFHLGIAVDTEEGLVVPVIRDVDHKGVFELAAELNDAADRARRRKLGPNDLRGACFTVSSLGGIGGTSFSPIVNAPEVAILGLSKTRVQPVWQGASPLDLDSAGESTPAAGHFEPRLVLPLSLSYDHRVIDGAEAVRFTTRLSHILADPIQLLL
jgi:pyruvate dehydrogenase E2 component (dihydrolipoamide acetyltransferase)